MHKVAVVLATRAAATAAARSATPGTSRTPEQTTSLDNGDGGSRFAHPTAAQLLGREAGASLSLSARASAMHGAAVVHQADVLDPVWRSHIIASLPPLRRVSAAAACSGWDLGTHCPPANTLMAAASPLAAAPHWLRLAPTQSAALEEAFPQRPPQRVAGWPGGLAGEPGQGASAFRSSAGQLALSTAVAVAAAGDGGPAYFAAPEPTWPPPLPWSGGYGGGGACWTPSLLQLACTASPPAALAAALLQTYGTGGPGFTWPPRNFGGCGGGGGASPSLGPP